MSANNPDNLTLALQKATDGFTVIVDWPTDTEIIDIDKLLFPILMQTKYNELTLTENLSGVILPTDRWKNIQAKGAYWNPPVVTLYDD